MASGRQHTKLIFRRFSSPLQVWFGRKSPSWKQQLTNFTKLLVWQTNKRTSTFSQYVGILGRDGGLKTWAIKFEDYEKLPY